MRILVVDDNPTKTKLVISRILEVSGINKDDVEVAHTARDARQFLRTTQFDLLILDIALPEWADSPPSANGGVLLLEEIVSRDHYRKPRHIVGLTAFTELASEAGPAFENELWNLIQFDPTSNGWSDLLRRKIKHIQMSDEMTGERLYDYDLAIVTALDNPEFSAILDIPWNWRPLELRHEAMTFQRGTFRSSGHDRRVIAASASDMGMVSAAITSMRLLYNFHPRYLCMAGITAGVRGKCNIGDVLVADPCWDYGSGKMLSISGHQSLMAAPYQIRLPHILRGATNRMISDSDAVSEVRRGWRSRKPDTDLKVILGPIGSGAAVRTDKEVIEELQAQHRKTVGLEMEAFGVLSAAFASPLPEVRGFVMKSVSDFADPEKSDDFQEYAAYTSANVLKLFAERFLPF